MPSFRLLQAVEVFVCTLVSWCLQSACSFGITEQHFWTEDENFLHLKFIAFSEANLQCSSMSPVVMHTQPRIHSLSFPTNTNTKAIKTRNWEAVSLPALPGVLFEAGFRSDQHSWNTKDLLRLVYSCSETQEPHSSYSTHWGIPVLHESL